MSTTTESKSRTTYNLPLQPLWDIAMVKADRRVDASRFDATGFTFTAFAEMIGYDPKSVSRWVRKGTIPLRAADEAAVRLNYHPVEVWGEQWLNAKGDLEDILAGKYDEAIERDFARAEARMAGELVDEITAEAMA